MRYEKREKDCLLFRRKSHVLFTASDLQNIIFQLPSNPISGNVNNQSKGC
jgi:hypothetical protein